MQFVYSAKTWITENHALSSGTSRLIENTGGVQYTHPRARTSNLTFCYYFLPCSQGQTYHSCHDSSQEACDANDPVSTKLNVIAPVMNSVHLVIWEWLPTNFEQLQIKRPEGSHSGFDKNHVRYSGASTTVGFPVGYQADFICHLPSEHPRVVKIMSGLWMWNHSETCQVQPHVTFFNSMLHSCSHPSYFLTQKLLVWGSRW